MSTTSSETIIGGGPVWPWAALVALAIFALSVIAVAMAAR